MIEVSLDLQTFKRRENTEEHYVSVFCDTVLSILNENMYHRGITNGTVACYDIWAFQ